MKSTDYADHLRVFLTHYLPIQRNASKSTITSYRDTFVQLIRYCQKTCNIYVEKHSLDELKAERILEFLDYIESEKGVCSGLAITDLIKVAADFPARIAAGQTAVGSCDRH